MNWLWEIETPDYKRWDWNRPARVEDFIAGVARLEVRLARRAGVLPRGRRGARVPDGRQGPAAGVELRPRHAARRRRAPDVPARLERRRAGDPRRQGARRVRSTRTPTPRRSRTTKPSGWCRPRTWCSRTAATRPTRSCARSTSAPATSPFERIDAVISGRGAEGDLRALQAGRRLRQDEPAADEIPPSPVPRRALRHQPAVPAAPAALIVRRRAAALARHPALRRGAAAARLNAVLESDRGADRRGRGARARPDHARGGGAARGAHERAHARAPLPLALHGRAGGVAVDRDGGAHLPPVARSTPEHAALRRQRRRDRRAAARRVGRVHLAQPRRRAARARGDAGREARRPQDREGNKGDEKQ